MARCLVYSESCVDRDLLPLPHAPLCTRLGNRLRVRFWVLLQPRERHCWWPPRTSLSPPCTLPELEGGGVSLVRCPRPPRLCRRWLTGARTKPHCGGCSHTCLKCVNLPPRPTEGGLPSACCCSHRAREVTRVRLPRAPFVGMAYEQALLRGTSFSASLLWSGAAADSGESEQGVWREGCLGFAQCQGGKLSPRVSFGKEEGPNWGVLHDWQQRGRPQSLFQSMLIC